MEKSKHKTYSTEAYVCRDEDGYLGAHLYSPKRINGEWRFGHYLFSLPREMFPELTWEDEPLPITLSVWPRDIE